MLVRSAALWTRSKFKPARRAQGGVCRLIYGFSPPPSRCQGRSNFFFFFTSEHEQDGAKSVKTAIKQNALSLLFKSPYEKDPWIPRSKGRTGLGLALLYINTLNWIELCWTFSRKFLCNISWTNLLNIQLSQKPTNYSQHWKQTTLLLIIRV